MTGAGSRKKLSLFDATMLVMGGIIGVGIFFTPQQVAQLVPSSGLMIGLWVFGAVVALAGAMTFAELGGSFPRSGGWYVFLLEAFGPFISFLFAWVIMGVVATGAIAVIASFAATQFLPAETSDWRHVVIAAGVILGLTGLTACGIKLGATFQNLCMLTKLIALLALIVAGLVFFVPLPEAPVAVPEHHAIELGDITGAFLALFFAFGGWQHLCYVAPELENPQRNLPRAIVLGVCGVALTYVLVNLAYVRVLGVDGLATTKDFAAVVAHDSVGGGFAASLRVVMGVSAVGVCAVNIIVGPWIFVAMARSGVFFESFGRVSARTGAPVLALILQAVIALGYLGWAHAEVLFGLPKAPPDHPRMDPNQLAESVVFAEWFFHGLVAFALLKLRYCRPDLPRPFKSFLWPAAPILYLVTALAILIGNLADSDQSDKTKIGVSVILAGVVLYFPWRSLLRRRRLVV